MKHLFFTLLLLCGGYGFCQPADNTQAAEKALIAAGATWQSKTSEYASLRFKSPVTLPATDQAAAADLFLETYGPAFNLEESVRAQLLRETRGIDGRYYRHYQIVRDDVPVLGAELTVELTSSGAIRGLSGSPAPKTFFAPANAPYLKEGRDPEEALPELGAAPTPSINDAEYTASARRALLTEHPHALQWNVVEETPIWTRRNPWRNDPLDPLRLTRSFRVSEPGGSHAVMVYLDVATGRPVFQHALTCSLNRRLYHGNTASFNSVWREGDAFPGALNVEDTELLLTTAETYNLFARTFGRNGFDGENGEMRGVTNATLNNCPNANAGTNVVRHCTGVVADDVVAHEWSHSYTNSMNGLIYAYESGAINEAIADIFGECIDLVNGRGNDFGTNLPRTGCDDGNLRWHIGEDMTAIDTTLRDLWLPECKNDPSDRESELYACLPGTVNNGGVHTNSGLVNRTFALLTDGGALNGDTIEAIGMTRALHLFQHASANYVTRVTDFFAFGDMLIRSAEDLVGTPLTSITLLDLPAMTSPDVFSPAHVEEVIKAVRATELRKESPCLSLPTLAQGPPAPCASALIDRFGVVFSEDWENGLLPWDTTETPEVAETWNAKPWRTRGALPDGRPGLGAYAPNPRVGNCQNDFDNGRTDLTSPVIRLPVEENEFILSFDHYYAIQKGYDGGFLFMSRNGGGFLAVLNQHFLFNGYDGRLENSSNNDNPLAGRRAFTGADLNGTSGTWGRSIVDLTAAGAKGGDEIRLRWTMTHDGCDGWLGWFIDDVRVGFCGESALPVDLLRFTAVGGKDRVDLSWATANESDNEGFYVERQAEGAGNFTELGFVAAGANYEFTDFDVRPGSSYVYRLRQVDTDGTITYSELVLARTQDAGEGLRAWPNPVQSRLFVRSATDATAVLYDGNGREVRTFTINNGLGETEMSGLSAGVYFLRVGEEVRRVVR